MEDVIKRVREHGELLAKGAPHQQGLGKDIVMVVDVYRKMDDLRTDDAAQGGLIRTENEKLKQQVTDLEAIVAELSKKQTADDKRMVVDLADPVRSGVVYSGAPGGLGGLIHAGTRSGPEFDMTKHGPDGYELIDDGANTYVAEVAQQQKTGPLEPSTSTSALGQESTPDARKDEHKNLIKAEKKARAKALQKDLDTSGKVDGEPK